ncbi:MAG TPA: hydrogenase nickel incorporation protein HypB [Candidatus Acidoferrum sp.]|nr:hydrogenase nickel incorporation protein HypB [Candidatus Acidoferrum sp.]
MCQECGCGLPGEKPVGISAHHHDHDHGHPHHDHGHGHSHSHPHSHGEGEHQYTHSHSHSHEHGEHDHAHGDTIGQHRVLEVRQAILEKNDRLAERNRGFFHARGLLVLNVLSSPGSGKTTLIRETVRRLGQRLKTAVVVGDLATDNDAQRLRESGAPVVQINTGTVCHLEAGMVARALKELDLNGVQLLIIENVGNLVCPASYDLGEDSRVVLLSVTEGEDKPLKYPPMFQSAGVAVVSKIDLAAACDFNRETVATNLRRLAPRAQMFEVSAKTGQGMDAWCEFLIQQHQAVKARDPLGA